MAEESNVRLKDEYKTEKEIEINRETRKFLISGDGHFSNIIFGLLALTTSNELPTQFLLCFLITVKLGLRKSKLTLN
jgi:hypothetical protein